jgi:hypothetical protein
VFIGADVSDYADAGVCASGQLTTVIGPLNLLRRAGKKSFTIVNLHPTQATSGGLVQVSPDVAGLQKEFLSMYPPGAQVGPSSALWMTINSTAFSNIAPGEVRGFQTEDLWRWFRVQILNTGPTAVTCSGYCLASLLV